MIFIYSLATKEEPNNIRYIGKSSNPADRFKRHLQPYYLKENNYKANWLKSILKKGHTPIMEIIDCVPEDSWSFWEQYWIEQFKSWGFKLTNTCPGGEGIPLTKEIIKKRSKTASKVYNAMKNIHNIREENNKWLGDRICPECREKIVHKMFKRSDLLKKIKLSLKEERPCFKCAAKKKITNITSNISKEELVKNAAPKKDVLQFSKEGNFIKEFPSIREAARETKISRRHISGCCNNKYGYKTAGGFIWKYKSGVKL